MIRYSFETLDGYTIITLECNYSAESLADKLFKSLLKIERKNRERFIGQELRTWDYFDLSDLRSNKHIKITVAARSSNVFTELVMAIKDFTQDNNLKIDI